MSYFHVHWGSFLLTKAAFVDPSADCFHSFCEERSGKAAFRELAFAYSFHLLFNVQHYYLHHKYHHLSSIKAKNNSSVGYLAEKLHISVFGDTKLA